MTTMTTMILRGCGRCGEMRGLRASRLGRQIAAAQRATVSDDGSRGQTCACGAHRVRVSADGHVTEETDFSVTTSWDPAVLRSLRRARFAARRRERS